MRVFYTNTAGATFFQGTSHTFVFRKDYIEIVWNFGKSSYGVTNLFFFDKDEATLCCNWGSFFNRVLHHEDPNKLFSMLKKPCPLVVGLFTNVYSQKESRINVQVL